MAGGSASAINTKMTLKWQEFSQKMARAQKQMDRVEAPTFVKRQARRLIKKWAFLAPIKTGRLRAGFWPAAIALQMTNIYTSAPNMGEGIGINNTADKKKPSVLIRNSVPYVANAGRRGTGWWFKGLAAIQARMIRDLEPHVQRAWKAGG